MQSVGQVLVICLPFRYEQPANEPSCFPKMQGTGNKADNGVRTRKDSDASFIVMIILILLKKIRKGLVLPGLALNITLNY